jgi:Tol biopolymer transport system component
VPISVGQTLGRYRIEEQIGAGGMGVVYRAYDAKLERDLAIKVLSPGTLDDEASRKRFRNEARVLSRLNHPSIQTIHDFDNIDGHDLLVSELVPGVSLDARVAGGPLPEKEVIRLGLQLAQGLAAAHAAGVLHRDLKPANLRVTPDGRLKILDFGLATISREAVMTLSTTETMATAPTGVAGTLPYMSPEQLLSDEVDERSDIYSAGVVLFELITRQLPFSDVVVPKLTNSILHLQAPSPALYVEQISPELERIILKCLEKDPDVRYQSAKELAADLRRMEAGTTRVMTAVQAPARRKKQHWMYGIGIGAVLGVVALAFWLGRPRPASTGPAVLRWEQLTRFIDSASVPVVSPDGKGVAFIRGPGRFGGSAPPGEIWFKALPDGEAVQLTNTKFSKHTLAFSPDGTRLYFTQVEGTFLWNTYEVSLLGGQGPRLFMSNASGLSWVDKDRVLFSEMKDGIHMALVTSNLSRTEKRDVYVPVDSVNGMAHRSALSPDGKWVLAVEMDSRWWIRCRLVPFDGSSPGREVGPDGSCTAAQWSPDGKWMYFTVESGGFHIWRQRFPDGEPEQMTPRGASEEEGLAVMPDGKSLITAAGSQEASIWLHDEKGDRQLTSEGFAFQPTLSPDGKRLYYLQRSPASKSFLTGELYVTEVDAGRPVRLIPGVTVAHYSLSHDGKKLVFTPEMGGEKTGVWTIDVEGLQPPRQISRSVAYRVFFSKPGEIIYEGGGAGTRRIMRINEDGSGERAVRPENIMQVMNVAPDGKWAIVGVAAPGEHQHGVTSIQAIPLEGGEPQVVCNTCVQGFGSARTFSSFATWSHDGKWLYIPLRYASSGSTKTVALPLHPGSIPAIAVKGLSSEEEFARLPGARVIPEGDIFPGTTPAKYVFARGNARTNLFRIYLSQ